MAALHACKDPIRSVLNRQVKVVRELWHLGISLDQAVGELDRVRRSEANALDAVDRRNVVDECCEVCYLAIVHRAAVGIDVLAEQVDLGDTLICQADTFGDHAIEWPADLLAARVGHNAKTAILAAAFHDRYERGRTFGTWLREAIELLNFRKRNIDNRAVPGLSIFNQLGEPVQCLRSKDNIDKRRTLDDAFAFLARDAAAHTDHYARAFLLEWSPATQLGEYFFLGLLAYRAGIDEQ